MVCAWLGAPGNTPVASSDLKNWAKRRRSLAYQRIDFKITLQDHTGDALRTLGGLAAVALERDQAPAGNEAADLR